MIARTEALIAGLGEAEALARGAAYADAGADAVLIHSKQKTPDEILSFCKAWHGVVPLVLVPTSYPQLSFKDVAALGKVGMIICGNHAIRQRLQLCRRCSGLSWRMAVSRAWKAKSRPSRRSLPCKVTRTCGMWRKCFSGRF